MDCVGSQGLLWAVALKGKKVYFIYSVAAKNGENRLDRNPKVFLKHL